MGNNLRTKEAIALGEEEGRNFYDIIEASETFGWFTFDQSIMTSYKAGLITEETALAYASRKPIVMRNIDAHKHTINQQREDSGLRMPGTTEPAPVLQTV